MVKILLIEDSEEDQDIFNRLAGRIKGMKIDTEWAVNLSQASEMLAANSYDLIISDLGLPDCNGIDCLGRLKEQFKGTPLIILTGYDDDSLLEKASHIGVYDYLVKGDLTSGVLRRSVRYALSSFEARSEKAKLESQLHQAQRIDALGKLTGGIAHDFNNKLAIILGNLEIIKSLGLDSKELNSHLVNIEKIVEVSAGLTKQLLAFGRQQELQKESVDINNVVSESLKFLERVTDSNIDLKINFSEKPIFVNVDYTQLDQVIMNLVINARDAVSEKGGKIEVHTKSLCLGSGDIPDYSTCKPGKYAKISVKDNGSGIPIEIRGNIFEPFFTTKSPEKGTGLGLSVVDGIVSQLGGFITIDSEEGRGTAVCIYLRESQYEKKVVHLEKKQLGGGEGRTVLYVEDEVELRTLVCKILEAKGFNIISANNGEEALSIFKNRYEEVDVILTDAIMPNMGGKEFIEHAREISSNIGVVFVSGYSEAKLTSKGQLPAYTHFHSKPADIKKIIESLAELSTQFIAAKKAA